MSEWISYRCPKEKPADFLALNYDGKIHHAEETTHGAWSITSSSFMSATHWMPLPAPASKENT